MYGQSPTIGRHTGPVSPPSQSTGGFEQPFNVNAVLGVDGGVDLQGSSINHGILHEQLSALLADYERKRRPRPTAGFKRKNRCLVPVLRLPFGRGVVATAILRGPFVDVKEYVQNCSEPIFRVVETYSDAIVHLVIESAQLLRAGRELPAILHKDVCTAYKEYGIHLKLHQRHRVEGDEVMSREEVASVFHERAVGGFGIPRRLWAPVPSQSHR